MGFINFMLTHPLTRGLSVDDPRTTEIRHEIIQGKPFLKSLYLEWYEIVMNGLNSSENILEIGSGAGFFKELLPSLLASEVMQVKNIDFVADATNLPFLDKSLNGIVMTDVLHHIPVPQLFFSEGSRCLDYGGKILMIEPWPTPWSEFIYGNFHSEPFNKKGIWSIPSSGPLSGANGALPWILLERDRAKFEMLFPELKIIKIEPFMPISYLLSGGVSLRYSLPGFMYKTIRKIEASLNQKKFAMFAYIEIERIKL